LELLPLSSISPSHHQSESPSTLLPNVSSRATVVLDNNQVQARIDDCNPGDTLSITTGTHTAAGVVHFNVNIIVVGDPGAIIVHNNGLLDFTGTYNITNVNFSSTTYNGAIFLANAQLNITNSSFYTTANGLSAISSLSGITTRINNTTLQARGTLADGYSGTTGNLAYFNNSTINATRFGINTTTTSNINIYQTNITTVRQCVNSTGNISVDRSNLTSTGDLDGYGAILAFGSNVTLSNSYITSPRNTVDIGGNLFFLNVTNCTINATGASGQAFTFNSTFNSTCFINASRINGTSYGIRFVTGVNNTSILINNSYVNSSGIAAMMWIQTAYNGWLNTSNSYFNGITGGVISYWRLNLQNTSFITLNGNALTLYTVSDSQPLEGCYIYSINDRDLNIQGGSGYITLSNCTTSGITGATHVTALFINSRFNSFNSTSCNLTVINCTVGVVPYATRAYNITMLDTSTILIRNSSINANITSDIEFGSGSLSIYDSYMNGSINLGPGESCYMSNVTYRNNFTVPIAINLSSSTSTFINSTFDLNSGWIYDTGVGTCFINNSNFTNTGKIKIYYGSLSILNSNITKDGGTDAAINASGEIYIYNTNITGSQEPLCIYGVANVYIIDSNLSSDTVDGEGVCNEGSGYILCTNTTLNRVTNRGGIMVIYDHGLPLTFITFDVTGGQVNTYSDISINVSGVSSHTIDAFDTIGQPITSGTTNATNTAILSRIPIRTITSTGTYFVNTTYRESLPSGWVFPELEIYDEFNEIHLSYIQINATIFEWNGYSYFFNISQVPGQPVLTQCSVSYTYVTDENIQFACTARDPEGDPLTVTCLVDGTDRIAIPLSGGERYFSDLPMTDFGYGLHTYLFNATDGALYADEVSGMFFIPNHVPVISNIIAFSYGSATNFTLIDSVVDVDGDHIDNYVFIYPEGVAEPTIIQLNYANGTLFATYHTFIPGNYTLVFNATDGLDYAEEYTVPISIMDSPIIPSQVHLLSSLLYPAYGDPSTIFNFIASASNATQVFVDVTLTGSSTTRFILFENNTLYTRSLFFSIPGDYTYIFNATDGTNYTESSEGSFTIYSIPVGDPHVEIQAFFVYPNYGNTSRTFGFVLVGTNISSAWVDITFEGNAIPVRYNLSEQPGNLYVQGIVLPAGNHTCVFNVTDSIDYHETSSLPITVTSIETPEVPPTYPTILGSAVFPSTGNTSVLFEFMCFVQNAENVWITIDGTQYSMTLSSSIIYTYSTYLLAGSRSYHFDASFSPYTCSTSPSTLFVSEIPPIIPPNATQELTPGLNGFCYFGTSRLASSLISGTSISWIAAWDGLDFIYYYGDGIGVDFEISSGHGYFIFSLEAEAFNLSGLAPSNATYNVTSGLGVYGNPVSRTVTTSEIMTLNMTWIAVPTVDGFEYYFGPYSTDLNIPSGTTIWIYASDDTEVSL
jgi:hypothetical protein